jgi:hypothetical protein
MTSKGGESHSPCLINLNLSIMKRTFPYFWQTAKDTYEYNGNDISFGDNHEWVECGGYPSYDYNQQPILLNGKEVGTLIERMGGRIMDEMEVTFIAPATTGDEDKQNVFWEEDESKPWGVCFRTLQEFVDYIK